MNLTKNIKIALLLFTYAFLATAIISKTVIQHFPNSAEQYAYVFQAKNVANGKIKTDIDPRAATVLLLFFFTARYFPRRAAALTLINTWFLLTSSTYFSHSVNAFFIGLASLRFFNRLQQRANQQGDKLLFYRGLAFGFSLLTRYLDKNPSRTTA